MAGKRKKSTKPSGTSFESLSFYTFFLDRALDSDLVYNALVGIGARVQRHRDHFRDDELDVNWLPVIGRRGWVILSKDQFNWLERRAIMNAKARAFLLSRGELRGEEMAAIMAKALPEMLRVLDLTVPPFIAKIYRDGSVSPPSQK
jgi:hypothetical protein